MCPVCCRTSIKPFIAGGIIGGHLGQIITDSLHAHNIHSAFYQIEQESRNCIAILHDNGKQTEILESGPTLNDAIAERFKEDFAAKLKQYPIELVTMSGSLPSGLSSDYYQGLLDVAASEEIPVILDTSGAFVR